MRATFFPAAAFILSSLVSSAIVTIPNQIWGGDFPVSPLQENEGTEKLFSMASCNGFKLEDATIDQLQEAMKRGELTSVQFVVCYLQRHCQTEDYINSILQINPDALSIAAQLDYERFQNHGQIRSPLHGIPFLAKENIATLDKLQTTASSFALLGSIVPRDAHVIKKLREAGAVLLGKPTMSEWVDMSNNYSEGGVFSARWAGKKSV